MLRKRCFYESRNLSPDNIENYKDRLALVDWNSPGIYCQTDAERSFNIFLDMLTKDFNECCPLVVKELK